MGMKPIKLAMKMCTAINYQHGCHVVLNTRRFYRGDDNRMVNMYNLYDSYYDKERNYYSQKLYTSSSSVSICFFLQELMAAFEGRTIEIPTVNNYHKTREYREVQKSLDYMVDKYAQRQDVDD